MKVNKIPTFSNSKRQASKFRLFLMVHKHRVFRGFFITIILFHMILLLVPWFEIKIPSPPILLSVFKFTSYWWPFPTYDMMAQENLFIRQLLVKTLEISVILLYTLDLLPKIFIWRKSTIWKGINLLILFLMMIQLPATIIAYDQISLSLDKVKLRLFSISLYFVLVCEILSLREQRALRFQKLNQQQETIRRQKQQQQYSQYSWCEIVKHDRPEDCWIVIQGKVYDVTEFAHIHPGGNLIYDGAGGDCTAMWHSYHPTSLIKQDPPKKYCIGTVRDYEQFYSYDGDFYSNIKQEVERAIPRNKWQNHWKLFMKAAISIIIYFLGLYYYITLNTFWSALLLGFAAGQVDVNIMHDGNHAAFSSNKLISTIAGWTLDLTFSTSTVYKRSHTFGHHACVNHFELDRAFDTTYPLIRLHHLQPRLWYHKYQQYYIWIIYGFVNFSDVYATFDEMKWFSNFPCRRGHVSQQQQIVQLVVKLLWIHLLVILPAQTYGYQSVFPIWILYMMFHGYNYALFFAVNHWTLEAGTVDNSNISQVNWGKLQIENSSNFALDSNIWTYLSGGLNYQIEHHLFPQLAHTRLPEIKKIVEQHSKAAKVRYFSFPTFFSSLRSHYQLLRQLGEQDQLN